MFSRIRYYVAEVYSLPSALLVIHDFIRTASKEEVKKGIQPQWGQRSRLLMGGRIFRVIATLCKTKFHLLLTVVMKFTHLNPRQTLIWISVNDMPGEKIESGWPEIYLRFGCGLSNSYAVSSTQCIVIWFQSSIFLMTVVFWEHMTHSLGAQQVILFHLTVCYQGHSLTNVQKCVYLIGLEDIPMVDLQHWWSNYEVGRLPILMTLFESWSLHVNMCSDISRLNSDTGG